MEDTIIGDEVSSRTPFFFHVCSLRCVLRPWPTVALLFAATSIPGFTGDAARLSWNPRWVLRHSARLLLPQQRHRTLPWPNSRPRNHPLGRCTGSGWNFISKRRTSPRMTSVVLSYERTSRYPVSACGLDGYTLLRLLCAPKMPLETS